GPDNFTYETTAVDGGTVTGVGPEIDFTGLGSTFTLDPSGGFDTVTVVGTSTGDVITATGDVALPTVQVLNGLPVTLPVASTESLVIAAGNGDDQLTVDSSTAPFLIPIVYDGGAGTDVLALTGGTASSDIYNS